MKWFFEGVLLFNKARNSKFHPLIHHLFSNVSPHCWSVGELASYAQLGHLQLRSHREDTPSPLYQSTELFCKDPQVPSEYSQLVRTQQGKAQASAAQNQILFQRMSSE